MELKKSTKESFYFIIRVIGAVLTFLWLVVAVMGLGTAFSGNQYTSNNNTIMSVVMLFSYGFFILLYVFFIKMFLVAHVKGNGVQISERQFPLVHGMIDEIARAYGMKKAPPVYLVQHGGVLNAFAVRFAMRNYIAIYTQIFEVLETDPEALKFVIAHEMAHVKNAHMQKRFWTLLSGWIPFLGAAYSRACEYTCDNYGASLSGNGAANALVMLAAGRELYVKVDKAEYLATAKSNDTALVKFMGLFLSHPWLPRRLRNLGL